MEEQREGDYDPCTAQICNVCMGLRRVHATRLSSGKSIKFVSGDRKLSSVPRRGVPVFAFALGAAPTLL